MGCSQTTIFGLTESNFTKASGWRSLERVEVLLRSCQGKEQCVEKQLYGTSKMVEFNFHAFSMLVNAQ